MIMRRSGSWQSVWDDRILEWLHEHEGSGTPKQIDESDLVRVHKSQISRRLKKLAEHDLVKHIGNGAYVITEQGEAYLQEEYDAERGVYMNRDAADDENGNGVNTTTDA
jgi:repressor of nif and glnA expression